MSVSKNRLQNDLLCVKWDVKPYAPTHCLQKIGATLNFAFALRPMGRKTLNGHKSRFWLPILLKFLDELVVGVLGDWQLIWAIITAPPVISP